MTPLKIMIVEDSPTVEHVLKSMLERLGHKVVGIAKSGAQALRFYDYFSPDLVTMDIRLPDMDGVAVTEMITKSHPRARVIVVTGVDQQETVASAIKAGAKGYILKPFQIDKLRNTLERVMEAAPQPVPDRPKQAQPNP